jgi:Fur family ferric uptake transcriptional regulator
MVHDQVRLNRSGVKVMGALRRIDKFTSAQSVYQELRKDGESTGLATVYRTLAKAAARNSVDVLRKDDGEALYRLCETGHHHHLICTSCSRTIEVEGSAVERWASAIAKNHGFREVSHVVELFGLCGKC